mmetsp:Transcript_59/g.78  ORF Transcript_59/g.78 Transcript_59/m.78 type:complete len:176 (-) Transcript_59:7-534(-)
MVEKEEDENEWIDLYADTERNRRPVEGSSRRHVKRNKSRRSSDSDYNVMKVENEKSVESSRYSKSMKRVSSLNALNAEVNARNNERVATARKSMELWKSSKYVPENKQMTSSRRYRLSSSLHSGHNSSFKEEVNGIKRNPKKVDKYLKVLFQNPSKSVPTGAIKEGQLSKRKSIK